MSKQDTDDKVLYMTVYFYRCVELEIYPATTREEAQDKVDEISASEGYMAAYDGLDIETVVLTPELLASLTPAVVTQEGGNEV